MVYLYHSKNLRFTSGFYYNKDKSVYHWYLNAETDSSDVFSLCLGRDSRFLKAGELYQSIVLDDGKNFLVGTYYIKDDGNPLQDAVPRVIIIRVLRNGIVDPTWGKKGLLVLPYEHNEYRHVNYLQIIPYPHPSRNNIRYLFVVSFLAKYSESHRYYLDVNGRMRWTCNLSNYGTTYEKEIYGCDRVEVINNYLYLPEIESVYDASDNLLSIIDTSSNITCVLEYDQNYYRTVFLDGNNYGRVPCLFAITHVGNTDSDTLWTSGSSILYLDSKTVEIIDTDDKVLQIIDSTELYTTTADLVIPNDGLPVFFIKAITGEIRDTNVILTTSTNTITFGQSISSSHIDADLMIVPQQYTDKVKLQRYPLLSQDPTQKVDVSKNYGIYVHSVTTTFDNEAAGLNNFEYLFIYKAYNSSEEGYIRFYNATLRFGQIEDSRLDNSFSDISSGIQDSQINTYRHKSVILPDCTILITSDTSSIIGLIGDDGRYTHNQNRYLYNQAFDHTVHFEQLTTSSVSIGGTLKSNITPYQIHNSYFNTKIYVCGNTSLDIFIGLEHNNFDSEKKTHASYTQLDVSGQVLSSLIDRDNHDILYLLILTGVKTFQVDKILLKDYNNLSWTLISSWKESLHEDVGFVGDDCNQDDHNTFFRRDCLYLQKIYQQNDGKIIVMGGYTDTSGNITPIFYRYNQSGGLDLLQSLAVTKTESLNRYKQNVLTSAGDNYYTQFIPKTNNGTDEDKIIINVLFDVYSKKYVVVGTDYFVITDDDFIVNKNILDVMIDIMVSNNICLAQPSRSLLGEAGHPITRQIPNLKFRFTNFVEIGPLFIIRNDLLTKIPLYLEDSPQGFGYDLIWFEMIKKYKTKFAIIDCCIASHGMRKVGETYNHGSYQNMKKKLLKNYPSIKFMENYDSEGRTIKSWPVDKKYL